MPKPTYSLQLDHGSPVYRNDRSRAEVSRLAGPGLPDHSQQGLTHSETEFSLTITVNAAVLEPGRTCVALGEARGVWRLSKLEVDIVREHPPGTCPHAVIRAHEDQHVAMAQRMFIRHAGTIRARLGQLVAQSRPSITALAPAQATQVLRDQLMEGLKTTLAAFERDLARANAAIDTPQNYKAETAKCPRWE